MHHNKIIITILGSAGGVANGILSILNNSAQDEQDPIYREVNNCIIHLIDNQQKDESIYSLSYPHIKDNYLP
ncbi:MAG TPA: hypothetical protein VI423_05315 [Paenisporosarcina sp.]|nr:hypothetical protein [Paenisporosarcina sp.]